jgi:hypothetical protein
MTLLCKFLLPLLVLGNMVFYHLSSSSAAVKKIGTVDINTCDDDNPDYTFYGGDIYYIKGLRLYTESGEVDTMFSTKKDLSLYLENASAETYKRALDYEIYNAMANYSSVLVFNDGTVQANMCNPYTDNCIEIVLNEKDCDDNGSCLYYFQD